MASQLVIRGPALARNAGLNLLGQGIPLAVALVSIPLIVKGLGPEKFGIITLAWVLLDYFSLFDLGLARAVTKFVAEALGRGEADRVAVITWSAVTAQSVLGVLAGLVLIGVTPLLVRHLHVSEAVHVEARTSFLLLSFALPLGLVSSSLRGVLEAAQRFDLVNAVRLPFGAANFLLPVLGVSLHWSLPTIIALLVVSRAAALLVYYRVCLGLYPSLGHLRGVHRAEFRVLLGYGGWITVSSIAGPVLVYLDRFLVGVILSVAAVAFYAAPYEMVTRLLIVPTSLMGTLFPAFSALFGLGERDAAHRLLGRSVRYLLLMLGPIIAILIAFGHDIVTLWLGTEFARQSALALQILAVGVLVNSMANVPYSMLQARGRPDLPAKFHLIELPLHCLVAWLLVKKWGIPGAAAAWSLRTSIDAILLFLATHVVDPGSSRLIHDRQLIVTGVLVLSFGFLSFFASAFSTGLLRYLLPALGLLILAATAWRYSIDPSDRRQLLRALLLA